MAGPLVLDQGAIGPCPGRPSPGVDGSPQPRAIVGEPTNHVCTHKAGNYSCRRRQRRLRYPNRRTGCTIVRRTLRIVASRAAQSTAYLEAGDPSTPTKITRIIYRRGHYISSPDGRSLRPPLCSTEADHCELLVRPPLSSTRDRISRSHWASRIRLTWARTVATTRAAARATINHPTIATLNASISARAIGVG